MPTGICPQGYMLQFGGCYACQGNCATCETETSTCTGCKTGFYLNPTNSVCQACPVGCKTCSSTSNCYTCSTGFTLVATSASVQKTCKACQSPCATCYGQTDRCITCVSGYSLNGWACQTSYTLVAQITMDTTFATFFSSGNGYVTYVQQLQTATNSASASDVLTTSMVNGSVNSNSAINIPDSSDNSATLSAYNGLNSLLSSGNIGGATILSYTITASGGDLPSEGVNLALILGITIPLGIIRTYFSLPFFSHHCHRCPHLLQV